MLVDCGSCAVRGQACDDCVISALVQPCPNPVDPNPVDPDPVDLDDAALAAIQALADAGLVPQLRYVARPRGSTVEDAPARVPAHRRAPQQGAGGQPRQVRQRSADAGRQPRPRPQSPDPESVATSPITPLFPASPAPRPRGRGRPRRIGRQAA